jgi:hypothetical protein
MGQNREPRNKLKSLQLTDSQERGQKYTFGGKKMASSTNGSRKTGCSHAED